MNQIVSTSSQLSVRTDYSNAVLHLPFVKRIAQRFARRLPSHIRLEDLVSAGVIGLLEAMKRYDEQRNPDFHSYAEFRVKGAILDELRRRDLMARDARIEAKLIEETITKLTAEVGREPEEEEIAEKLEITVEDLRAKLGKIIPVRVMSLQDVASGEVPRQESNPHEHAEHNELILRLSHAISKLGERHQQVLHLYYQEELTLKEIGQVLKVTESRVCQIVSEATLRLRALMQEQPVIPIGKGGTP